MKTRTVDTLTRSFALVAACAVALSVVPGLRASDIEKGATRLMNMGRPAPPPEKSGSGPMTCEKCRDVVMQVPDLSAKGAQILMTGSRPTKPVVQHQCEGCVTTLQVVGHGKAKTQVAKHTCTSCGSASEGCCSATRASPTNTRGMENAQ